MKNYFKKLIPYLAGVFSLLVILQIYLYLFDSGRLYYSLGTLFKNAAHSGIADRSYVIAYVLGIFLSGSLTVFFARNIRRLRILIVPTLSVLVLLLLLFFYEEFDPATEMRGLGARVIGEFLYPVNIIFSFLCSIFFVFKDRRDAKIYGPKPMNSKLRMILNIFGILIVIFLVWWVVSAAYYLNKSFGWQKQTKDFELEMSKPYREDTYGGKTPEETWAMFIDALKKDDAELASKYFVPEKQEEWKKIISDTVAKNKLSIVLGNIPSDISLVSSTKSGVTMYYYYNVKDGLGGSLNKNSIVFILNSYTNIWKISLL